MVQPAGVCPGAAEGGNPLVLGRALLDSQYFNYILGAASGDLGPSYQSKGTESVQQVIGEKFPSSAQNRPGGIVFALLVGIPLGIIGALRQNSWLDYLSLGLATIGVSVPTFIIGVLLIIFMSQVFGLRRCAGPRNGSRSARPIICPASCLASAQWRLSRA